MTTLNGAALAFALLAPTTLARAQAAPPIRQVGPLEHVTPDSLGIASINTALAMPGGRVMIDDVRNRRVLLVDSTLTRATVVADTTGATADAYGSSWATLIRYRGDTALLMVPSTLSMFVIGPTGAIARVMAIPRPDEAQMVAGGGAGMPGLDAAGRLVYFGGRGVLPGIMMLRTGMQLTQNGQLTPTAQMLAQHGEFWVGKRLIDSSVVVRVDLESHALDTAAWIRIPRFERNIKVDDDGKLVAIETTPDALPLTDEWIVLRNGTLAIARGRDFHIDWVDAADHVTSTAKLPFDWKPVSDAEKQRLIDSAVTHWQQQFDEVAARRAGGAVGAVGGGSGGRGGSTAGRGGGGGGGGGGGPAPLAPMIAPREALSDVPDYFPPFNEHALSVDANDDLWIESTESAGGRPVYFVVNRAGALIDRVQIPAHRAIVGFGPGVVYMAVTDVAGAVHLERARIAK